MAEISVSDQSVVIVDDSDRMIVLSIEKFKKLMNLYVRDFQEIPREEIPPPTDNEVIEFDEEDIEYLQQIADDKEQEEQENAESYDVIEDDEPYDVTAGMREDFDERDEE